MSHSFLHLSLQLVSPVVPGLSVSGEAPAFTGPSKRALEDGSAATNGAEDGNIKKRK